MSAYTQKKTGSIKLRNSIGLNTALKILDKWGATTQQSLSVLRISRSTFQRARKKPREFFLDADQVERISMVLNIHATMRSLFENPENVYGFMRRPNDNEFFNGRSPLDIMSQGGVLAMLETYRRVMSLNDSFAISRL